jgi:hypothetical protein
MPLLKGQADDGGDLRVVDLTDEDIDFIVEETGLKRRSASFVGTRSKGNERATGYGAYLLANVLSVKPHECLDQ